MAGSRSFRYDRDLPHVRRLRRHPQDRGSRLPASPDGEARARVRSDAFGASPDSPQGRVQLAGVSDHLHLRLQVPGGQVPEAGSGAVRAQLLGESGLCEDKHFLLRCAQGDPGEVSSSRA